MLKNGLFIVIILLGVFFVYTSLSVLGRAINDPLAETLFRGVFLIIGVIFFSVGAIFFLSKKLFKLLRRKLLTDTLIKIIIMIVVIVAILEIGFRIVDAMSPSYYIELDSVYHHSLIAGREIADRTHEWDVTVATNSLGLRNQEITEKKGERILMLGDSFTLGQGVENNETFSYLLDEKLGTEVINGGVTSYSPILYYLFLRNNFAMIEPDRVIVNLDASDVVDDYRYLALATFNNAEVERIDPFADNPLVFIFADSKLVKNVRLLLPSLRPMEERRLAISDAQIGDVNHDRFVFTRFDEPFNETHPVVWNVTSTYIKKIVDFSRENDIEIIFVLYPYGHQVEGQWKEGRKGWLLEPRVYSDINARMMEEFLVSQEVHVINTFDDFRAANGTLFYESDGHFTKQGHEVMAESIFRGLV